MVTIMKEQDNNLDEKISKSINGGKVEFDFESWKSRNPDAVKALQEVTESSSAKSSTKDLNLWRTIMRSQIIKLAAAAVIILAVVFGIPFFSTSSSSVSLAGVYGKMQLEDAFMYKVNMTTTGNMQPGMMPSGPANIEATILVSNDYGIKMDNQIEMAAMGMNMNQQVYVVPEDKSIYMILPEQKLYMTMELDESWLEEINKEDPRDVVKQVLKCKFTELGKSTIDGIEVEGFETTDPAYVGGLSQDGDLKVTLWVDSQTWLPVRMEMYIKGNEQMQIEGTIDGFEWDLQVDASEFEPMIPDDYTTPLPGGIKIPGFSEDAALVGLRNFAQAADRYPKNLNILGLTQETMALRDSVLNADTEEGEKLREQIAQMSVEERMRDGAEKMLPFQSLGMFYMKLVQDGKEPVYYGETVGPDDTDKILLRYKTGENEYRVIYGDLSAETVDGTILAELESQIEQ